MFPVRPGSRGARWRSSRGGRLGWGNGGAPPFAVPTQGLVCAGPFFPRIRSPSQLVQTSKPRALRTEHEWGPGVNGSSCARGWWVCDAEKANARACVPAGKTDSCAGRRIRVPSHGFGGPDVAYGSSRGRDGSPEAAGPPPGFQDQELPWASRSATPLLFWRGHLIFSVSITLRFSHGSICLKKALNGRLPPLA